MKTNNYRPDIDLCYIKTVQSLIVDNKSGSSFQVEQSEVEQQFILTYYDRSVVGKLFAVIGLLLVVSVIKSSSDIKYLGIPILIYIFLDFLIYRKYFYHLLIQLQGPYNIKFILNLVGAINIYAWLKVLSEGALGPDFLYVIVFVAITLIDIGIQSHYTHLTTIIDKSSILSGHKIDLKASLPFFGFPLKRKLILEIVQQENSDDISLNYAVGKSTSDGGKFSNNSKVLLKFLTQSDLDDIVEVGISHLDPKTYYRLYLIQPGYTTYSSLKEAQNSQYIVYKSYNPVNIVKICSKIQEFVNLSLIE